MKRCVCSRLPLRLLCGRTLFCFPLLGRDAMILKYIKAITPPDAGKGSVRRRHLAQSAKRRAGPQVNLRILTGTIRRIPHAPDGWTRQAGKRAVRHLRDRLRRLRTMEFPHIEPGRASLGAGFAPSGKTCMKIGCRLSSTSPPLRFVKCKMAVTRSINTRMPDRNRRMFATVSVPLAAQARPYHSLGHCIPTQGRRRLL